MTGTFWDTIVVCTITGLCIASSGVLGTTEQSAVGRYVTEGNALVVYTVDDNEKEIETDYTVELDGAQAVLTNTGDGSVLTLTAADADGNRMDHTKITSLTGDFVDTSGERYHFSEDGVYSYDKLVKGSALTILAFETVLGKAGGYLVCIGIALFAFSTILGWEYHGEKAFEYLFGTHKYNMVYRIIFSLVVYIGATTALDIVWNFSDIANALMAVPNLICLLALSGVIAKDVKEFQQVIRTERENRG